MSKPLAKLEARIEELERASEELREVTREAHGALKDLRKERTEVDAAISRIDAVRKDVADFLAEGWRETAREVLAQMLVDEIESIRKIVEQAKPMILADVEAQMMSMVNEYLIGESDPRVLAALQRIGVQ